jgi:hypothetical protein
LEKHEGNFTTPCSQTRPRFSRESRNHLVKRRTSGTHIALLLLLLVCALILLRNHNDSLCESKRKAFVLESCCNPTNVVTPTTLFPSSRPYQAADGVDACCCAHLGTFGLVVFTHEICFSKGQRSHTTQSRCLAVCKKEKESRKRSVLHLIGWSCGCKCVTESSRFFATVFTATIFTSNHRDNRKSLQIIVTHSVFNG